MGVDLEKKMELPAVDDLTSPMLQKLTEALGVDRKLLASDKQIQKAWNTLPDLLAEIPAEKRDEIIMRMCVAVASGLFDSAINYAWNAAVMELRDKVRQFGINIIPQIIDKEFDEAKLLNLQDSDLLSLCLKLNLISEGGYFMLDQCRDIRNNFSAAHPAVGSLDEYEFINFLNRCNRHALSLDQNTTAVDIKELIDSIHGSSFTKEQLSIWCNKIKDTFEAQREAIILMLHGIYCDPKKDEHIRINSIKICKDFAKEFTPTIFSELINQHQRYQSKGKQKRFKASRKFFEDLGIVAFLSTSERHAIISSACKNLMGVHNAMNNFYNEQPFAQRLEGLSSGQQMPETVRNEFVETIVTCSVGNVYGTAHSADPYYQRVIQGFSPREIEVMLSLPEQKSVVGNRINSSDRCKKKFKKLVELLQEESIPTKAKSNYSKWLKC